MKLEIEREGKDTWYAMVCYKTNTSYSHFNHEKIMKTMTPSCDNFVYKLYTFFSCFETVLMA